MFMRRIVRIFLYIASIFAVASCADRDSYVTITGFAQGGTYAVKFNMNGPDGKVKLEPVEIRDAVDSILRAVDMSVSGYNRKSLLSRFNSVESIVPDRIFIDIYEKSYDIYEMTDGVVDVASAPLFDIWGFGFANDSLPSQEKVAKTLAECGMGRLRRNMYSCIDSMGNLAPRALLLEEGAMPELNYNAVAQGYSCDLVAEYLYSIGVKDMLVDIGEIFCDGVNPSGLPWTLGIDRPVDGNNELGADVQGIFRAPEGPHGIVTSGNYRKFYVRDGKKYAHTIDPRNGYPVEHTLLSATVVAPDATSADAFATYCMVIGLDASREFISSRPDLEACLIYDDNGIFKTWTSSGFVLEEYATSR